jgi:hypothetical protein
MYTLHIRSLILGIIGLCTVLLSLKPWVKSTDEPNYEAMAKTAPQTIEIPRQRESITFIMGEDKDTDNPYYTEALNYYRHNPEAETDYIITSCRSLVAVRNYLEQYPPENGQAWGLVNIILHSNEWSGLGVPVQTGERRASVNSLKRAVSNGDFACLENEIVDAQTEIVLHGCALGKNREMLETVSMAFGGIHPKDQRPIVRSSRFFVFYESLKHNGIPQECNRYLAQSWYAFYKLGYRPGDIRLSRQLQERYPDANINWRDALSRTSPRYAGEAYHYTFNVPIIWTVTYADESERPDLNSKAAQEAWLSSQDELQEAIQNFGIPKDKFNWVFRNIDYTFEDGVTEPAIKAVGYSTILCVLKTLTKEEHCGEQAIALIPDLQDEKYYTSVQP